MFVRTDRAVSVMFVPGVRPLSDSDLSRIVSLLGTKRLTVTFYVPYYRLLTFIIADVWSYSLPVVLSDVQTLARHGMSEW